MNKTYFECVGATNIYFDKILSPIFVCVYYCLQEPAHVTANVIFDKSQNAEKHCHLPQTVRWQQVTLLRAASRG